MKRSIDKFDYDLDSEIEKVSSDYENTKKKEIIQHFNSGNDNGSHIKILYFFSFICCISLLIIIFIIVLIKDITKII
jgi:hypothetical protein